MIDTHAHLNFKAFEDDWEQVTKRARQAGVEKIIVVGTDVHSSKRAVRMAEKSEFIYAGVGIHPHHVRKFFLTHTDFSQDLKVIKQLAKNELVVGIGEVGLDYHYYKGSKYSDQQLELTDELKELQRNLLQRHIELALELNKPLIMHSRAAKEDVLNLLKSYLINHKSLPGVFHCFDGSKKYASKILEAGFYISFTGNITYNQDRSNVAKMIPLNRLLLETDCPFMLPEPKRTAFKNQDKPLRSEPSDVKIIGQFHADLRNISANKVFSQTTKNANQLFKFK